MPDRRLDFCDVCLQLDDHPKHRTTCLKARDGRPEIPTIPEGAPVDAVARLLEPQVSIRHIDCCAAQGCETCSASEAATGGRRGPELVEHLNAIRETEGAN